MEKYWKRLRKKNKASLTNSNIDKSVMQMITNKDIENLYDLINKVKILNPRRN